MPTLHDDITEFLADTSSLADPYPLYRRLREAEPVMWSEAGYWVVTSFAEAEACFRHPRLSRYEAGIRQFGWIADDTASDEVARAVDSWRSTVLNLDPPDHTRLRRLISRAFAPRAVAGWKARTEEIVDGIVGKMLLGDSVDLVSDVGYPVPETVICELLGVPLADHDLWKQWGSGLNRAAIFKGRNASSDALPADVLVEAQQSVLKQYEYFSDLVARRRGTAGGDLIALLMEAEEAGDRLTHDEMVGTLILLIGAGHHTTANLIANGMLALMESPDQYALLRSDPRQHAAGVVEETLRYDGSARGQPRVALDDLELGGQTVRRGDTVMVIINAANRDPDRFPDPERFDITRGDSGHLAFASGVHFCAGAALARMEAEVAFRLIAGMDGVFELATDSLAYLPTHGRNLTALPARYVNG